MDRGRHRLSTFWEGLALILLLAGPSRAQEFTPDIRLNQIGFYPDAEKVAAVVGVPSGSFTIMTADLSETVYTGALGPSKMWAPAQESIRLADFSDFAEEGEFVLVVPEVGHSHVFEIDGNVHQSVAAGAIKGYYFQRASTRLLPMYADVWTRSAGHPDDQVEIHPSAATAERPAGTIISAPRGWYDAGDYNKYVANSGISTGTLLMLYEHFPEYFGELDTNIPESGNGVPDILDEILWNVRWMQAMQDPHDGGVYTKLTTANFEGFVMPNKATSQRYVVMKSTAATLDFVAVSALTARLIARFESVYPGLADSLIDGANRAWNWAQINPEVPYNQGAMNQQFDPDINTGGYGDNSFFDEFRWAAAEMFVTTKQDSFLYQYPPFIAPELSAPGFNYVDPMAFITLSFHGDDIATVVDTAEINEALLRLAKQYVNIRRESATGTSYGTSSGDFFWGCNSLAANEGFILLQAYRVTDDQKYLDGALANLDYLLGRNATGFSFLTGFGDKTPMHPHHRQSQSDGVDKPVPGLLAGGPNPYMEDGCAYPSTLPAKAFLDDVCSYASNEIAINWNAPFAYLAGAIDAIYAPTGRPVSNERDEPPLPDRGALFDFNFGPNPSSARIRFEFTLEQPEEVAVQVFDMLGREVARPIDGRSFLSGSHQQSMRVDSLPTGLYAITFATGSRRVTRLATIVR